MRRAPLLFLFCAALAVAQTPTVAAPELQLKADNLTDIKSQLVAYAKGGVYDRAIADVVKAAHDWVETRAASTKPNEKLAAIFDIDETSLSNIPEGIDCGFCSAAAQVKLFPGTKLPAITPVRDLYNFAKSKGIAMIFLTGRSEGNRAPTAANLAASGYSGWVELLMRPVGNTEPARIMKANQRKAVEQKGYKIVLNIGDQLSDLIGGYAERTYKLPNPFYFVE